MTPPPLASLRVVDLSTWIAGAYCTKLLADGGADVTKVEAPGGDPLRVWSASGATIAPGTNGGLFNFLGAAKRSVVVDPEDAGELASLHDLLASADAVVWSRGSELAEHPSLRPGEILRTHPHLTVAAITPFGLEGPWCDMPATEFTLQAWAGAIVGLGRGTPDRAPVHVGGQVGEWLAGVFAALGVLSSRRRDGAEGELVDVSMLEALVMGLTYYPVTFHDQLGRPMRRGRSVPTPGVAAARDGLIGLGCGTGQQWLDFCVMVGHPEWTEDPSLFLARGGLAATIDAWVGQQARDDLLQLAGAFRIPSAPIVNGENAPGFEHFQARQTFHTNASDGAVNPRPPYRLSSTEPQDPQPAPSLGEHRMPDAVLARPAPAGSRAKGALPFSGLRVLDMTAYWAGPLVGHVLALLGAEVIHLESAARPDGARLVGGVPQSEDQFWERSPIFAALNSNKKSVTIDLRSARGIELVRQLVATCDVVVENFTPRVLDQLGLAYDTLRSVRPDLVMLRMPGFGLDGPWRDLPAFAFVVEDASGLTWLTGHPDQLPLEPYCLGDPNAGLHGLFGLMVALERRDRTGEGSLVEAAMVDSALNIAAEQVIEHSAYGALLTRTGNRGPVAAPQNLYLAADADHRGRQDTWVAIAVASQEQWEGLCRALGAPTWTADAVLSTAPGRVNQHDLVDAHLAAWCRDHLADDIVARLWDEGVPVAKVMQPHEQPDIAQLSFRGFFEELEHPVAGRSRYSTLPMRFSAGPERLHVRHAPLLGEHNTEILTELGLSPSDIDALEAEGVIGRSVPSAARVS